MNKIMIAAAAFAGVLGLAACNNAADDETAMDDTMAAEDSGLDASGDAMAGDEAMSGDAASAGDTGSDASAPGSMMSGDTATAPQPMAPATGETDPMVTGQGSMREEDGSRGQIDMPSEPAHPARQ